MTALTHITKGEREALNKIADGGGSFHRLVGEQLEAKDLAYPVSGILNFLVGCNSRDADGWTLTVRGAEVLGIRLSDAA